MTLTYTRKPFSKETKRAALLRSDGLCEGKGPIVNLPEGVRCHAFKTFKRDIPMHAKVKRQSDKHNGIHEAKGRPMPGTKASGLRKKLNGSVERR